MITNQKNPKIDVFLSNVSQWRTEFEKLREIVLDSELIEELKWGVPCYTYDNHNVIIIHGFKEYCALLFIKGALLHDTQGILIQQTQNVQAGRQIRFTNLSEITQIEADIKAYIHEAIENEKAGLEIAFKKNTEYSIPLELQTQFDQVLGLKTAFEALTPGRQRAYLLFFSDPKQAKTRQARVEKYIQAILNKKGLND
jgi:uncharacterized protein YdeI (YjbR/CyaY-like superfamily)